MKIPELCSKNNFGACFFYLIDLIDNIPLMLFCKTLSYKSYEQTLGLKRTKNNPEKSLCWDHEEAWKYMNQINLFNKFEFSPDSVSANFICNVPKLYFMLFPEVWLYEHTEINKHVPFLWTLVSRVQQFKYFVRVSTFAWVVLFKKRFHVRVSKENFCSTSNI